MADSINNGRRFGFDARITLGNVLTLIAMLAAFAIWYGGDVADKRELQVELRHVKEQLVQVSARLAALERRP